MSFLIKSGGKSPIERFSSFFDRKAGIIFPLPAVTVICAVIIFPILYTIYMCFHSWYASSLTSPVWVGLENFRRLFFEDERFKNAIFLTFYFTSFAISLQLLIGLGIALVLNREFKGKGIARTLFLLPMVATPVAVALVWMFIFNPEVGVLNYLIEILNFPPQLWVSDPKTVIPSLVLVDTWEWTPLITLILLAGLANLPKAPYEAAIIDGASRFQLFKEITLPLLRPTIMAAMLIRSIDCLKTFDIIMAMTQGGPGFSSETLNIYIYNMGFFYFHIGYTSSILVVLFAVVSGVSLILIKLRRGAW